MVRFTLNILNFMNLLLVSSPLLSCTKSVGTGGHTADEGVGGPELLLHAGGDFGVEFLDVKLKFRGTIESPPDSLLPAGVAERRGPGGARAGGKAVRCRPGNVS